MCGGYVCTLSCVRLSSDCTQVVLRNESECNVLADLYCHLRLSATCHCNIDQYLYIISAAIGKVLFERKPLGELFVKTKRTQNDCDDGQLNLWDNFFGL